MLQIMHSGAEFLAKNYLLSIVFSVIGNYASVGQKKGALL